MPERHGLRGNPFRETRHDHEMVGRKTEMSRILLSIDEAISDETPSMIPILGGYGAGKSFTLYTLRDMLRQSDSLKHRSKVLTAYVRATQERFPSKYALYMYLSVVEDITEQGFLYLRQEAEAIGKPLEEILASLGDSSFRNAFIHLGDERNRDFAWSWLRGETLPAKIASDLKIIGKLGSDERARGCLRDLCRLLKALRYDGMVFLIDELEQAYAQGKNPFSKLMIWLRSWHDMIGKEVAGGDICTTITVFACAPETWQRIAEEAETAEVKGTMGQLKAFWDRITPGSDVNLKPFDQNDIKTLIRTFLSKAMKPGFKPPDAMYPFEEAAATLIFDVSFGIPRSVIRCARILLREADEEGKKITAANAERWLRKAKIIVLESE